jgi:hypothetical protein
MARRQIGRVQALWRYPVKSMRGEELPAAELTEHGMTGDRVWALRELDRGGIMSARVWAAILQLAASYEETSPGKAAVRIELPDARSVIAGEPDAAARLSELFGRAVELVCVRRERLTQDEVDALTRGEAYPPARDFFDEDVMHLVASGTLAHLRTLKPDADFDPRRFRANIYVDTGDEADGFIEDRWLDGVLEIGESAKIAGMRPAIRCVMTTHSQPGLARDMSILRTAAQHHGAYVGVFASVAEPGQVRVGDPIVLIS